MNERCIRKAAFSAAFLFSILAIVMPAYGSIDVSPVRVDFDAENTKAVIRVTNREETAKSYQVEVVAWSQTDERSEVYAPTDEIVAVPPLFIVQPGEEQLVRIGLLGTPDADREGAYRLFITELATSNGDDDAATGIDMRLQIGIPVFVAPASLTTATLDYVDHVQTDSNLFMRFRNSGNSHVKVSQVSVTSPVLTEPVTTPISIYVHGGRSGFVPVELPAGVTSGTVRLTTDTLGMLEYELPALP